MSRILIAGGAGLIGRELTRHLEAKGHSVCFLSRTKYSSPNYFQWDPVSQRIEPESFQGVSTVINLSGLNIMRRRWTAGRKAALRASRIDSTGFLISCMVQYGKEVKQLISASAIGFYGDQDERYLNESHIAGEGFLAKLCEDWEKQALMAESFLEVYIMRIGLYLHPEGGVLKIFRKLSRFYALTGFGNGRQWQGITPKNLLNDFIEEVINHRIKPGTYNLCSESLRLKELLRKIAQSQNKVLLLPSVPAWLLKIALGESAQALLYSHRIDCAKLKNHTFLQVPALEKVLSSF